MFLQGVLLAALSFVGVAAVIFSQNKIVSSWVARIFLILLPMSIYYLYVGTVGVINYHTRMFLDETEDPPWPPVTDGDENERGGAQNNNDDDDDRPVTLGDEFPSLIDAEPGAAAEAGHAIN